jgi:glutamyl-tRNA synthetase
MSKSAGASSVKYMREIGNSKAEVFSKIGSLIDPAETIHNWEDLAQAAAAIWL